MFKLIRDWQALTLSPCVAAIGNFDGLHVGHHRIITQVVSKARQLNLMPCVITFEPLPQAFLKPELVPFRLASFAQKMKLLKAWGIQQVICLRFNEALARVSAWDFMQGYLVNAFRVQDLIVGENFRFGASREGDVKTLQRGGQQLGFNVVTMPLAKTEDLKISSTFIRQALLNADFTTAKKMLGRNYCLQKRVIKGAMRGRQLGFPTANLPINPQHMQLRGVFITKAHIGQTWHYAVTNIGTRPTVDGQQYFAEAHLLDFQENIYGRRITLEFLAKIRDEKKFTHVEQLKQQIANDIEIARNVILEPV